MVHPHIVFGAVDQLRSVGPTLLAFLTGSGASILYSILKKDGWSATRNNVIVLAYAAVLALLDSFLKGQLTLNGGLTMFLLVYGSSLSWYNAHKIVYATTSTLPKVTEA